MLVSVAPARQRASTRVTEPPVVEPNVVDSLEISHEGDSRYALKCFAVASTARKDDFSTTVTPVTGIVVGISHLVTTLEMTCAVAATSHGAADRTGDSNTHETSRDIAVAVVASTNAPESEFFGVILTCTSTSSSAFGASVFSSVVASTPRYSNGRPPPVTNFGAETSTEPGARAGDAHTTPRED